MSLYLGCGDSLFNSLISLRRERNIRVGINEIYYAEKVQIKNKHPLNNLFDKILPECRKSTRCPEYTWSAESAILQILERNGYEGLKKKQKIIYNNIPYCPDAVKINPPDSNKPNYLIEVKSTKAKRGSNTYHCLVKKGALQSLRNAAAYVKSGKVREILPKLAIGTYVIIEKVQKENEKVAITLQDIQICGIGWKGSFKIDMKHFLSDS